MKERTDESADVKFTCSAVDFPDLFNGKLSPTNAFMQKRLKMQGDMQKALLESLPKKLNKSKLLSRLPSSSQLDGILGLFKTTEVGIEEHRYRLQEDDQAGLRDVEDLVKKYDGKPVPGFHLAMWSLTTKTDRMYVQMKGRALVLSVRSI